MIQMIVSRLALGVLILATLAAGLHCSAPPGQAQDYGRPAAAETFSRAELAQMLGPIALYPDRLLSQILMAATYPIEVIEADRWLKKNPGLQGDALDRALLDKEWDVSVRALCHFPAILALMSERIAETTDLGNAFLAQEDEVMEMIQELRAEAHARGNLVNTPQQKVIVERETIVIEPVNPWVLYIPYYDPFLVYGPWWYPAYPPYYWGPPELRIRLGLRLWFWPGIYFRFSWGDWCYFDWPQRTIYLHVHERPRFVRADRWVTTSGRWVHSPVHRRGVAYRDRFTAEKYRSSYSPAPQRPGVVREDPRGRPEKRELLREPDRRGDDQVRDDRRRAEQQRIERELPRQRRQQQAPEDFERQPRQQRLEHEPAGRERTRRQPEDLERQLRQQRLEQERRAPQRPERSEQGQPKIDRAPVEQKRIEPARPWPPQINREFRGENFPARAQPDSSRGQISTPGDAGQKARPEEERGRFMRQERREDSGGGRREEQKNPWR